MDYYELLEIDENTSQIDIKRAYFAKVRQFSPEKNPDMFVKIREAYDTLKDENLRKKYKRGGAFPDDKRLLTAKEHLDSHDFKGGIKILKNVLNKYPESDKVMLMLGDAYEHNNEYGKAAKIYESLTKNFKDNQEYELLYANSLYLRNYTNKAKEHFEKAVNINPYNPEPWLKWIHLYSDDIRYTSEILENAEKVNKDIFEKDYDIYAFLWMENNLPQIYAEDDTFIHCDMLNKFIYYYERDKFPSKDNINTLFNCLRSIFKSENVDKDIIEKGLMLARNSVDSENKYKLDFLDIEYSILSIEKSGKAIDDALYELPRMFYAAKYDKDYNIDYEMNMAKTYIISRFSKLHSSILYLKENYPRLYAFGEDFFEQVLDNKKRRALEKSLELATRGLAEPSELDSVFYNTDLFDECDVLDTTFRREHSKVGRNDPCHCGSGKKYKRCCGK